MSFEEPTPEERPFVDAILADLDDDGPRLVYADWLTEQGDPRGEFIHVQCRLDSLPMDDPAYVELESRERVLLKQNRAKWIKPLPKIKQASWGTYSAFRPGRQHFRRGLVEYFTFSKPKAFVDNQALFEQWPIRHVTFLELSRKVAEIVPQSDAAAKLRGFWPPQRLLEAFPEFEINAERFPNLEELALVENSIGSDALHAILEGFEGGRLRALDLHFNDISDAGVDHLLAWSGLSELRSLNLGLNSTPAIADGILRLVRSKRIANLHVLDLWSNDLGTEHAVAIADSKSTSRLVELSFNRNEIGDEGLAVLAGSKSLKSLRSLNLGHCGITDRGMVALAESPESASLANLSLVSNAIGDEGLRAMAESPHLANLRIVDLSDQRHGPGITPAGLRALAESPHLERIEFLNLGDAEFDDATLKALKKRFKKAFTDNPYAEPWLK